MMNVTTRHMALVVVSVGVALVSSGCKDTKIHDILASTAEIPAGSIDCLAGGTRVDYGYDDGSGEGDRDDGILHADEVTTSQVICHDDVNAPAIAQQAPAGPVGTNRIDVSGGAGSVGSGQNGGGVLFPPSIGGTSYHVFRTGSLTADVSLPPSDVELGAVPVEITSDTTLAELPGMPADGVYYDDAGGQLVVVSGGMVTAATGLHVASGVTLTLPALADNTFYIALEEDMHLEGSLSLAGSGLLDATIMVDDFWSPEGSRVDLVSGASSVSALNLMAMGSIASGSAIDGHLGAGAGAPGGPVFLNTIAGPITQTGSVDVSGDDNPSGPGGPGGSVTLISSAALEIGGDMDAGGGDGLDAGGPGGVATLHAGTRFGGDLTVAAGVDVSGGEGTGPGSIGGPGSALSLFCAGGDVTVVGRLLAEGGDGVASGGGGGVVDLSAPMSGLPSGPSFGARTARFDSDISLSGGDGESGGAGGSLSTYMDGYGASALVFYGVEQISLDGGAAGSMGTGGEGGYLSLTLPPAQHPLGVGAVVLRTDVMARGGAGGGLGGTVTIMNQGTTQDWNGSISPDAPTLVLEGEFDVSAGADNAAFAGAVVLQTARDMVIDGSIRADGADSTDDMAPGGSGGQVNLGSFAGAASLSGDVSARGGDGLDGGFGGNLIFGSSQSDIGGDVLLSGGQGVMNGGPGGSAEIASSSGLSRVGGSIDVAGGGGGTGMDGPEGNAFIDSF